MSDNDNQEEISPLSPKQERFIQSLIAGNTILASAAISGISDRQAHRWLQLPHVQSAYRSAQRQVFDESMTHLLTDVDTARQTLISIMTDSELPAGSRVSAAKIILEMSIEVNKISALEERIAELEAMVK